MAHGGGDVQQHVPRDVQKHELHGADVGDADAETEYKRECLLRGLLLRLEAGRRRPFLVLQLPFFVRLCIFRCMVGTCLMGRVGRS